MLVSTGYAPGTISVNVAWTGKGFDACKTPRSIYPSTFNRFPVIQPLIPKMAVFTIFGFPLVRPWNNRGKCHMDGKRIQCLHYKPIYLQSFLRYSEMILLKNYNFFIPLAAFNAPIGVTPFEFREKISFQKTKIMGLPDSEESLTIG